MFIKALILLSTLLGAVYADGRKGEPRDDHKEFAHRNVFDADFKENQVNLVKRSPYYYYSYDAYSDYTSSGRGNYGYYGYTDRYGYGFYYTGVNTNRGRTTSSSFSIRNNDNQLDPELDAYEIAYSNSQGLSTTPETGPSALSYTVVYVAGGFGVIGICILFVLVFRRLGSSPYAGFDFSTEGNTQYSYQSFDSAAMANASSYAPVGGYAAIPGASVYLPGPPVGGFNAGTAYGGGYGSAPAGTAYGMNPAAYTGGSTAYGGTAYGQAYGGTAYGGVPGATGGTGQTAYATRI